MAITCPGCHREYDVTLFQFGRTIHCTCGERVGLEQRLKPTPPEDAPRFIVDAMLGRLARWLRTLGWDTAYDDFISDADLVRRALEEDRILVTRDRKLTEEWRIDGVLVLDANETVEQLAEVVTALDLARPDRLFTRCRSCNEPLEPVTPSKIADTPRLADRVPPRVLESHERFFRCPGCDRVYWEGSHTDRMRRTVDRVFEGVDRGGESQP